MPHTPQEHRLTHAQVRQLIEDDKDTLLPMFKEKLAEAKYTLSQQKARIDELIQLVFDTEDKDVWVVELGLEWANASLTKTKKQISKWNRYIRIANHETTEDDDLTERIQQAKQVPIESLHQFEKARRTTQNTTTALCPFHSEKTPSFKIYHDDNHYHCFGCQEHGDAIDFIQKLHQSSFKEAVKLLT